MPIALLGLAVAWSVNPKTSIRTAYGLFYDTARFFTFPKTLVFTPPQPIEPGKPSR